MSVTVTPRIESRIQEWIERGGFPDADAVIEKALQALEEQEQAQYLKLRELVRAGFEGGNRLEFTDELMAEIERRAEERFARGERATSHVNP